MPEKPKPKQQRRRELEAPGEQEVREGTRRGIKRHVAIMVIKTYRRLMKSAGGEDWDYIQGLSSAPHLPSAEPPALKATAC